MSYDISLEATSVEEECHHCDGTGRVTTSDELTWWNYTSNSAWMWREAGADLAEFEGKTAGECAPLLKSAIDALEADPERFRAGNPATGWGDYDSLLDALKELLRDFEANPEAIVRVSR
jgi:hypothetical protein